MIKNNTSAPSPSNSAVERALTVLELIASKDTPVGVGEIAQELNLAKSTTHRILEALKSKKFIEQIESTEKYQIGLKAIEVGVSSLAKWNLVDIATIYLKQLATELNETSFLAVYDSGEIVYLYKAEGNHSVTTTAQLGARRPVHSTALGKAIVANFHKEEVERILDKKNMEKYTEHTITDRKTFLEELRKIKQQGYAMDGEEAEIGLSCFAIPVYDYTSKAIAAVSVAGPTERMMKNRDTIIKSLKEVNTYISARLGFVPTKHNDT